jgi:selenocysteine lyase/cysteine desulfurase
MLFAQVPFLFARHPLAIKNSCERATLRCKMGLPVPNKCLVPRRQFIRLLGGVAMLNVNDIQETGPSARQAPGHYRRDGEVDWRLVRSDFLFAEGLVYLNCSAMGAVPNPVLSRTGHVWQTLEKDPSEQGYGALQQAMDDVRGQLARSIGCSQKELIATNSTTDGMNTVAQGIGLSSGQRVLTTDQEHPGGRQCWDYFARRYGAVIDRISVPLQPQSAQEILARFETRLTPETRVISVSHITFATGTPMPIRELSELAHAHGALCVVDGAQAVGSQEVDVKALACDAYCSCGHKWLLGPKGTGLLYISEKARRVIDPLILQDGERAYSHATGVRNIPGILGLGASLDYLSALGQQAITKHNLSLRNLAYAGLVKLPGIKILSPPPGPYATPIVSLTLPEGIDNGAFVATLLRKHRIQVKVLPTDTYPRAIRISPHIYNDEDDINRFLVAVCKEL